MAKEADPVCDVACSGASSVEASTMAMGAALVFSALKMYLAARV